MQPTAFSCEKGRREKRSYKESPVGTTMRRTWAMSGTFIVIICLTHCCGTAFPELTEEVTAFPKLAEEVTAFPKVVEEVTALPKLAEEVTLSDAEKDAVVKLRNLVKDELYHDYMHTDGYLVPWLRARRLNVNQAKEMLVKALKWRKDEKIDSILEEEFPQFKGEYTYDYQSRDKDGRPVLIIPLRTWNIRKAVSTGELENLKRYETKVYLEGAAQIARAVGQSNGSNSTQIVLITDLTGYTLRDQGCFSCLPLYLHYIQTYENYYPQLFKEALIVNMPWIFNPVLQLTRPFWSDHLSKHMQFVGYNKQDIQKLLTKYISLDQIPVELGGTNPRKIA